MRRVFCLQNVSAKHDVRGLLYILYHVIALNWLNVHIYTFLKRYNRLYYEKSLAISVQDAANALGVLDGDGLQVIGGSAEISLEVRVVDRMAEGCVGYSVGYEETLSLAPGQTVRLAKDGSWIRSKPHLIATDGASEASLGESLYV